MSQREITDDILERYRKVSVATVYSAVRRLGYEPCLMRKVRSYTPGKHLVGRARTLRFLPARPDYVRELPAKDKAPEYEAMGSCGPGDVLVCDVMRLDYAAIGGDVKLLQLQMTGAEGVVTDGAVRDMDAVLEYGYAVFAAGRTPGVGQPDAWPSEANVTIQCGGVLVRPGDLVVGDDDGVVVVANEIVEDVIQWAEVHEQVEQKILSLIRSEKVAPGRYYNPEDIQRFHQEIEGG